MVERKLPVKELTILSLCRFAEPIALTSVFPYLPEMIESFGVPENEVAKWAGLASAIFSLCQCITGIPWGRASDVFGRKYIILLGLTNTMVTSLLWGFSTSLPMALAARALAGAGNGNVGIIRTMVAEMCPWKELQPRAFSIMPLVWNIGSIFGPAFGGALSNPLRQDPRGPRGSSFLEKFPYALPNIVAAALFFVGIVIGFLFLHETLESRKNMPDYGLMLGKRLTSAVKSLIRTTKKSARGSSGESDPLLKPGNGNPSYQTTEDEESLSSDGESFQKPTTPPTIREALTRQSTLNLLVYTLLAMYAMGFDQLIPVFMHHPAHGHERLPRELPFRFSNGFGLWNSRIGLLFTLYGASGMLIQFFIFPPVARKFGVLRCLQVCTCCLPFVFFVTPFTALLPTVKLQQAFIFIIMLLKGICTTFMFPCSTILLTNSASSLRILGTLNGMATSISAVGRAAGPALGGATFTLGVKHNMVVLPFWIFTVISAITIIPVFMLEEGEGFGDDDDDNDDESGDESPDAIRKPSATSSIRGMPKAVPTASNAAGGLEAEMSYGSPGPLMLSRTSTLSTAFGSVAAESDGEEGDFRPGIQKAWANPQGTGAASPQGHPHHHKRRRSSVPIEGGIARKLSSNLGQSRSGYGTGGTLG